MTKYRVNFKDLTGEDIIYVSDLRTIFKKTYSKARFIACFVKQENVMIWKLTGKEPSIDDSAYILISIWRDGTITMNYKNEKFITLKYGERINEI